MRVPCRFVIAATCGLLSSLAAAAPPTAVEFFHAGYRHYFVTAFAPEAAALDANPASGWRRTGETFALAEPGTPGTVPVCRFWSGATFAPLSSHFYTADAQECAGLRAGTAWRDEGEAFAMALPDAGGGCAAGTRPLWRFYNRGTTGAPNHRFTVSPDVRAAMLAEGWTAEGAGTGVAGCVPLPAAQRTLDGHVVDGKVEGALVCVDANRNGRCDPAETSAETDATGAFRLAVAEDAAAPLVAEILVGRAHCHEPDPPVVASYRMASPRAYGTEITPITTLLHLTGIADMRLAEDLVRAMLGLPPGFDLKPGATGSAAALRNAVEAGAATALKSRGLALDLARRGALADVVAALPPALVELPRLIIETRDEAAITSREQYVDALFVLANPALPESSIGLNGKIRGRGNSTWGQPKNPYKLQFANDASYAALGDVLGMKKQRNWALLADWFDRSLLRNKLALSLGASSVFADGLKWTPTGQHVEVWLNGAYQGVYLLTEDIRIDRSRLDIRKMGRNDVDGGFILEADFRLDCYNGPEANLQIVTAQGASICVDTPDEESITPAQLAYARRLVAEVEADVYGPRRLDRIHRESFVDWYLLQELFRNNDAIFISSDFMWKDTDSAVRPQDRLLNMGPIWDFDRAAGNVNYNENWRSDGCWVSVPYPPNWIARMFDNADFRALTLARWQQKRAALATFVNDGLDHFARRLAAPQARNFERWPILGLQLVNYHSFATHAEEVAFLRRWLNERMAWMDVAFANQESFDVMCRQPE